MERSNLWEQIGNRCLELASRELNKETAPTGATVEAVERLVGIAIAIDALNPRWTAQRRFGAAAKAPSVKIRLDSDFAQEISGAIRGKGGVGYC